jgi:hypothetical protein
MQVSVVSLEISRASRWASHLSISISIHRLCDECLTVYACLYTTKIAKIMLVDIFAIFVVFELINADYNILSYESIEENFNSSSAVEFDSLNI